MMSEDSKSSQQIGIFVVHYSELRTRRYYLQNSLKNVKFPIQWITENDIHFSYSHFSEELNAFGVNFRLSLMDRSNNSRSIVKSRRLARLEGFILLCASYFSPRGLGFLTDNPVPSREPRSILELTLMHFECLHRALKEGYQWILVLEDDAIFNSQDLINLLRQVSLLENKRPAWYNVSSGANLTRTKSDPIPDVLNFFRVKPFGTRCSSGYLINRQFIRQAIKYASCYGVPDWTAIDIIYQILQRRMNAKVFWQEPPLVLQGSELGKYTSNFNH